MSLLKKNLTRIKSPIKNEKDLEKAMQDGQAELASLQERLYAERKWSVLIILQGMDTSGKDGLIAHVMKGINPMGCIVHSFKKPTDAELDHDFLWRTHLKLPGRGKIGIFNRSYYEDVIVPHVHPEILKDSRNPNSGKSKDILDERCEDIVNYEKYLSHQGTLIIKIFLHLSKSEQKKRLLKRLETPEKNWKFEEQDMIERDFWSDYQKAYDYGLKATSHKKAPWHLIPADDKPTARYLALKLIIKNLKSLNPDFPTASAEKKALLTKYKKTLT